jgi:hypothetical protein|tara:strand:- start:10036 stop:10962 length:927 start_codon:yes stop_codon:yes gene_type:complete
MKRLLYITFIFAIITSCEVIEGPYMNDVIVPVDTSIDQYVKNILIEDYTGHLCTFCPDAARELDAIHDVYGSQIIGLALHAGTQFGRPYPLDSTMNPDQKFTYDFRTSWGEEWDDFFEVSQNGLPKGMINRIEYSSGDHRKDYGQWSAIVGDELNKEVQLGITINSTVIGNTGDIHITTEALSTLVGNYKLVVCLAENQITNWQKDGGIEDPSYIHNHVLRTVLTSSWGENLSGGGTYIDDGDIFEHSYSINLTDLENENIQHSQDVLIQGNGNAGGWQSTNMNIIAYIYDVSNYEILQVEQASLIAK